MSRAGQVTGSCALADLLLWVREQTAEDRFVQVEKELAAKALVA